jgi:ribonuclease P protein component
VLPAGTRLQRREEFLVALRRGRRAGGGRPGLLVAHLSVPPTPTPTGSAKVGFVVSRTVGPAVVRNRVRRRLRHLVADRLGLLPPGGRLVVRALPPAANATYAELGAALDEALDRARQLDRTRRS